MYTIRASPSCRMDIAQQARLSGMFDGALPPDPPAPPATATHDFLVLCLRPDAPPPGLPGARVRLAA